MTLEEYRAQIDEVDHALVDLFQQRMKIAAEIADYKQQHGLPVLDAKREQEKLAALAALADPEFTAYVGSLYDTILRLSKDYQHALLEKTP